MLALVALLVSALACADEGVGLAVSFARQPPAPMAAPGERASVAALEDQASISLPSRSAGRWGLRVGLDYQYTHYDYGVIGSRDRDLHRLQLPLRFVSHTDNWRISGYVAPGIATSSNIFKDFLNRGSSEDWYWSGRVEAGRTSGDNTWVAGLAYDRSFGRDKVYPLLGIEVEPAENLFMRVAYPESSARWQPSDRLTVSGRLFPSGFVWRVVTDDFQNNFRYRTEGIRLQATWSYRFWTQTSIDLSLAYEFDRHHEFYDDRLTRIVADVGDEWLLAIGMRFGAGDLLYANGSR